MGDGAADTTGTEDRINRNLYLDAIQRAAVQAEEVSATIGPDPEAHRALAEIATDLNRYSGRIEAARVQNLNDLPGADQELRQAHHLYTEMDATGHAERLAREMGS